MGRGADAMGRRRGHAHPGRRLRAELSRRSRHGHSHPGAGFVPNSPGGVTGGPMTPGGFVPASPAGPVGPAAMTPNLGPVSQTPNVGSFAAGSGITKQESKS